MLSVFIATSLLGSNYAQAEEIIHSQHGQVLQEDDLDGILTPGANCSDLDLGLLQLKLENGISFPETHVSDDGKLTISILNVTENNSNEIVGVEWEVIDPVVNGTKGVDVLIWKAGSSSTFVELYDWTFDNATKEFTHLNNTNEAIYDFNTSDQATNPSNANSHISWCYDMELDILDAKISITPDATNEVGDAHNFTINVMEDIADGNGFVAAAGETVNVTFDTMFADDPADTSCMTNGTGHCIVTVNSNNPGTIEASASSNVNVTGTIIPRTTDGTGNNSGNATKTYVDAKIGITPDATNEVGDAHTFTINIMEDAGDGNGFVSAAGENATVTFDTTDADDPADTFCITNSTGQCDVVVNSNNPGTIEATASSVGGITVSRTTDGVAPNSGNATKTYVDAKISIGPNATNIVGDAHTFTINIMEDAGDGNGFVSAAGENATVTFETTDADDPADTFCITNSTGQCDVVVNSNNPGTIEATASSWC
jgi:hypothetical protein